MLTLFLYGNLIIFIISRSIDFSVFFLYPLSIHRNNLCLSGIKGCIFRLQKIHFLAFSKCFPFYKYFLCFFFFHLNRYNVSVLITLCNIERYMLTRFSRMIIFMPVLEISRLRISRFSYLFTFI